ncbi:hypothetical protein EV421DRAFT_1839740 [Armillaria borealis]|uniref:F-box domain-containing protein n=1 Tax=Armillaria borealis TaxID=47425 RepID=A0AA39MHV6_9AGAR|nr:hypothetical protein EV421DRAFT_1839740 [Armillaria borealis]
MMLLRTGQSSEGLHSATLASVMEHIRLLKSEIVARDEQFQLQATSLNASRLLHEHDLAEQDLKNHKSVFAPIRRLPNDVLLLICLRIPRMPHRQICSGDDRDIIWEDITLHSHRWSHISLIINELVPAFQNSSCHFPLLRSVFLMTFKLTSPHICRLFSSAPLLQEFVFSGTIFMWREVARAVPLSQLVRLLVSVSMHKLDDVSPDIYACMTEVTVLEELCFHVSRREDRIIQPPAESNAQLLPTFVHNNIKKLDLDSGSLSILDQCSIPNLKELTISSGHGKYLSGSEVESADPGVEYLLRFVERSECNVETFVSSLSMPLSTFKSLWTQWSSSLTKLTITVTSVTRVDAVRELTFEDGKPGILPKLQHLILRTLEGISIFQDGSLLQMVSSRLTRPGSFRMLAIETRLTGEHVLSQDIITQMNRLREMRAVGIRAEFRVFLAKDREYLDHFETDGHFAKFLKELEKGVAL